MSPRATRAMPLAMTMYAARRCQEKQANVPFAPFRLMQSAAQRHQQPDDCNTPSKCITPNSAPPEIRLNGVVADENESCKQRHHAQRPQPMGEWLPRLRPQPRVMTGSTFIRQAGLNAGPIDSFASRFRGETTSRK